MSTPAIEIVGVSKYFAESAAVEDINLTVGSGEFFSLLGPSGCGKTTLLRMIAGFETPSKGKIFVNGQDVSGVPAYRRPVNMVFQNYALFPHLSVVENVAFGLRSAGVKDKLEIAQRVKQALELVRLADFGQRFPSQLSGGQQQRVALARAVINRPAVLLLDEPLSALDSKIRQDMQDELAGLQERLRMTFIMVTHDQAEALALSNRLAVFYKGHLEQVGTPREIYQQPATAFVSGFIGHNNLLSGQIISASGGQIVLQADESIKLNAKAAADTTFNSGEAAVLWIRTSALEIRRPSDNQALAENEFNAVIASRSYQGAYSDYGIKLTESLSLRATLPAQAESFAPGDKVWVRLPTEHCGLLPDAEKSRRLQLVSN